MTLSFKKYPSSILYGSSRLTLNKEGKISEQRDYYDLWGDIFDNCKSLNIIPALSSELLAIHQALQYRCKSRTP
jgi:hypothetical protein